MRFEFTPDEAQPTALAVARHLQRKRLAVSVEASAWPDAPLRTTLLGKLATLNILVEVQGRLNYTRAVKDLAAWIAARRHYAELLLAVPNEATLQAGTIEELRTDGVGLLIINADDGSVKEPIKAKNPALIVTPDPNLRFGKCKQEVIKAVDKFNDMDRKDGLRDMCELVERETEVLAVLAARKGLMTRPESIVRTMDWSQQINVLASQEQYTAGNTPIVDDKLKFDMHSFRGARNLIDHQARNKRADRERQLQFAERMMQGPRLIAKLVSLQRKVK
jgi:hypothetical protein